MYGKFLFLTSFVLVLSLAYTSYGADTGAPTPNPMTWHTSPMPSGPSKILMRSRHAQDVPVGTDPNSPPVQYFFECTTDSSFNSGWMSETSGNHTTYTASGLAPSTTYSFRVKARDSATPPNETAWSTTLSATTTAKT